MTDVSNIGFVVNESLLLNSTATKLGSTERMQKIQNQLDSLPSVLDESTLTKLRNGGYEISLRQYTDMNSYYTKMSALYGNNSANKFQNMLNVVTNSQEESLANAKAFVDKLRETGMSNSSAVKTYAALQKYSLMTSFGNYNFVKAKV